MGKGGIPHSTTLCFVSIIPIWGKSAFNSKEGVLVRRPPQAGGAPGWRPALSGWPPAEKSPYEQTYDPNEVIGDDEPTTPAPIVARREEAIITVNNQPFAWADPLIIKGGQTYNIHIQGLRPGSKFIIRAFKAGQKAGAAHFDANEYGEIELEVTLDRKRFSGEAEVVYYPSSGKEIRRRFKVKVE